MKTKFQTFTNLSLAINDVTAQKSKKADKETEKSPNLLTMEEYNKEVKKFAPSRSTYIENRWRSYPPAQTCTSIITFPIITSSRTRRTSSKT